MAMMTDEQILQEIAQLRNELGKSKYYVEYTFDKLPLEEKEGLLRMAGLIPLELKGTRFRDLSYQQRDKICLALRVVRSLNQRFACKVKRSDFQKIDWDLHNSKPH